MPGPEVALAVACALHLGFQLTVTVLVYPSLSDQPPEEWVRRHREHSRRITPLVGLVYGVLLVAGAAAALDGLTWPRVLILTAVAVTFLLTATVAVPAHARLARGPDPGVLHRLLVADRVRAGLAVVAALLAAFGG